MSKEKDKFVTGDGLHLKQAGLVKDAKLKEDRLCFVFVYLYIFIFIYIY